MHTRGELDGGIPLAYTPSLRSLRAFRLASAPLFIPSLPLGSDLVEGIIIKKKDRLALLSHRRISIGIAVFFHFLSSLQTFQSTRVILFFNICYLWRYCDYGDRRFESYERYFITLRYYWIELNAILKVKLSRRISKDIEIA